MLTGGVLYDLLAEEEQKKDPLIEGCHDLSRRLSRFPEHGDELTRWTDELFAVLEETPAERRLRQAACILADIGWYVHPDYRANHCLEQILLAPLVGVDHPGRLFLARTGFHRHEGASEPELMGDLKHLLTDRESERARILGLALRLAFMLCAATPGVLPETNLTLEADSVRLEVGRNHAALLGETVEKRLGALAKALNRRPETIIAD